MAFIRKEPKIIRGGTILSILRDRIRPTEGDVGIEIEVEGNKFPKATPPSSYKPAKITGWKYWSYVNDGSLRGADNAEYVLTKPIKFSAVPKALDEVSSKLEEFGSVLDDSNRTSVHIHLNCQKFHMNRLTSFIALYFCFEEILTEWCGDHRVGNLFCLRAVDAPAAVSRIKKFIQDDGEASLDGGLHYAGLNTSALIKFGSLEIRTLRGVTDFSLIQSWVDILGRLYSLSEEYPDPRDIPGLFSQQGPLSFFDTILGEQAPVVRSGLSYDDDRVRSAMYEGIRIAQDLCYCRDWSIFQPVEEVLDPFGRVSAVPISQAPPTPASGSGITSGIPFNSEIAHLYSASLNTPTQATTSFNLLNGMFSQVTHDDEAGEYEPEFDEEILAQLEEMAEDEDEDEDW